MKRFGKKIAAVMLAMAMMMAMAVPAFAKNISTSTNNTQYIVGWNNEGNAFLTGMGNGATVQLSTNTSTQHGWVVSAAPDGNYVIRDVRNGLYINIHRILVGVAYYMCTEYTYESAIQGRDQRVNILNYSSTGYSNVQLAAPQMGGTWYMVADRSSPSTSSDVIWYIYNYGAKAQFCTR